MKRAILNIEVKQEVDVDADLSFLGCYSGTPGPNAIDRQARGDWRRDEYRYFNATLSTEKAGDFTSVEHNYQRSESYNRGDWWMLSIKVEAEVLLGVSSITQTISSGGFFGVASDESDYIEEVKLELLSTLRAELQAIGFSDSEIDLAYRTMRSSNASRV